MNEARLHFPTVNAFDLRIRYRETCRASHVFELWRHTHDECEIYINLSGDVSFMVENCIYPLSRGDVIIARPGQYHHCIYRSDAPHCFFWMLVSQSGNDGVLDLLFNREGANFISPREEQKDELIEICFSLLRNEPSDTERFYRIYRMLHILKSGERARLDGEHGLPWELSEVLRYIDAHIGENICISDIAKRLHVSESTVQRKFQTYLDLKPTEFIRKRRMELAARLLGSGESVLGAGLSVGYMDNSHFIKLFKQYYGLTPLQYKKRCGDGK